MRLLAAAAFCPFVLLVLAPALPGQDKDKMPETAWYPLQVGTSWTYKISDGKTDGKVTIRVAKHEKVGEKMCARLETVVDGKVLEFEHLAVDADGVYRYSLGGNRPDKALCILKLPPKKDQTWPVESEIKGEKVKGTFKSSEEAKLKVAAGEYEKVAVTEGKDIDLNGLKVSFVYYFADKVGPVKQVISLGPAKVTLELEEFKAGK